MNKLVIVAIMWCVLVVVGCDAKKQPPPPQSDVIELEFNKSDIPPPSTNGGMKKLPVVPPDDPALEEARETGEPYRGHGRRREPLEVDKIKRNK